MNAIKKSNIHLEHCKDVISGNCVYEFNGVLKTTLKYFDLDIDEAFAKKRRISDFKLVFSMALLYAGTKYIYRDTNELSNLFSCSSIFVWAREFKLRFLESSEFRELSIRYFEENFSSLSRRNLINSFKKSEI